MFDFFFRGESSSFVVSQSASVVMVFLRSRLMGRLHYYDGDANCLRQESSASTSLLGRELSGQASATSSLSC